MKKGKKKQKKKNSPPKKENEILTKEVGTYNGFLIFDKIEEKNENEFYFRMNDLVAPEFKDWMIIDSTKTKSRFTNLFQDILESDKIMDQKNNIDTNENIDNEEKSDTKAERRYHRRYRDVKSSTPDKMEEKNNKEKDNNNNNGNGNNNKNSLGYRYRRKK